MNWHNLASLTMPFWLFFIFTLTSSWVVIGEKTFVSLNETCADNSTCTIANSYCADPIIRDTQGKCTCLPKYVSYTTREENCNGGPQEAIEWCLPIGNSHGAKCSTDVQCTSGNLGSLSFCNNDGACQCHPKATPATNIQASECVPLAQRLGDSCADSTHGNQCMNIPFANCTEGICLCNEYTVPSRIYPNTCILSAIQVGDSCDKEDNMCLSLPNTECKEMDGSKTCHCLNSYVPNDSNSGCVKTIADLHANCSISVQCLVDNSLCMQVEEWPNISYTTCQCGAGYVESIETPDTCLPIRTDINSECQEDVQCTSGMGDHSECMNGECQCTNDGVLHNQKCYPLVPLGDQCLFDDQCKADVAVIPEGASLACEFDASDKNDSALKCRCPSKTHSEYNERCYENTGYNVTCATTEQCKASFSGSNLVVCLANKTCGCVPQYMISRDGSRCIMKKVEVGGTCEESKQCHAPGNDTFAFCHFESSTCETMETVTSTTAEPSTSTEVKTTEGSRTSEGSATSDRPRTSEESATTESELRTTTSASSKPGVSLELIVILLVALKLLFPTQI